MLGRRASFFAGSQRLNQALLSTNAKFFDIGYDLSRNSIVRVGAIQSNNTSALSIGTRSVADPQFKEGGARIKLLYDSLDDANFPKEGRVLQLDYYASLESLGSDSQYRKAEVNYQDTFTFGSNTFSWAARYGRALDDLSLSPFNRFSLGGFLQMSAFRPGEIRGDALAFGRVSYYRRLGQFSNPL